MPLGPYCQHDNIAARTSDLLSPTRIGSPAMTTAIKPLTRGNATTLALHPLIKIAVRHKGGLIDPAEERLIKGQYQGVDIRPALFGSKEFDWNCHISLLHRFLFLSVPKSACSTILLTLHHAETVAMRSGDYPRRTGEVHDRYSSPLLRPSQLPPAMLKRVLLSERFFRFCFVRNPFTRLLACYLDKVCRPSLPRQRVLKRLGIIDKLDDSSASERNIPFQEFLQTLSDPATLLLDAHWRPQFATLLPGILDMDIVGRVETFSEDFNLVCSRLNEVARSPIYFAPSGGREHSVQADRQLSAYYDRECVARVRDTYMDDFVKFGYSHEL